MSVAQEWTKTFRERFCEVFRCEPAAFEERVFWRTLHRHSIPLAAWLYKRDPDFFREDFDFIREIGSIKDPRVFTTELNRFHGRNVREKSWLRGSLSVRVSAKRLIRVKNQIFRDAK